MQYQIFIPGGNKTALLMGLVDNLAQRKAIQDKIMHQHAKDDDGEVEQVGFLSLNLEKPELLMAGGEFCGNATRAAAAYYLRECKVQEMQIASSGCDRPLQAGYTSSGDIWSEMPLQENIDAMVQELGEAGIFWVQLEGISHLVLSIQKSANLLEQIKAEPCGETKKKIALDYLENTLTTYVLNTGAAYGIMLLEEEGAQLKMHPFVYVETSDTCYYETACGSGTMCVGLIEARLLGWESISLSVLQPSGKCIGTSLQKREDGSYIGKIFGAVSTREQGYTIE